MNVNDFIKIHKAEDKPAEIAAIQKLYHEDLKSQEANAAALKAQRAADGQVTLKCPKCGVESVVDAGNRDAKCGAMTGEAKHGAPVACGSLLTPSEHPRAHRSKE